MTCWILLSLSPLLTGSQLNSNNLNDVNVTIAGTVCDVQSTNATHIICVTNAQRQSQETKVRVSIGDQGIAKMVRRDGPTASVSDRKRTLRV